MMASPLAMALSLVDGECQVGAAEGEVGGGGGAVGWQTGGGVSVEEAERAIVGGLDDGLPSC